MGLALSRLFISHSSNDNVSAIAFKQWLGVNGWPQEDVFLDIEDIGAGERWKEALHRAHLRCEAVILLASPDSLLSPECLAEVRKAEDYGKVIIIVILRDLTINDHRFDFYRERQIVDLSAPPKSHLETVDHRGSRHLVYFNGDALAKVKSYLLKLGISAESFPWPPERNPDAEPFPGLRAFLEDDAAIFFGRDADILKGLDEFRLLRRKGSPQVLAIQAASGAGKSSYLRAGLWPRLQRDVSLAPVAILRPAQGIITGPEGLSQTLARYLSGPDANINPGDISIALMDRDTEKSLGAFSKLMSTAAVRAHEWRRIGDSTASPPALVLAIDQAEELLSAEYETESHRFLFLLADQISRATPEIFALLTVRGDNVARLFEAMVAHGFETPKALILLPLPRTSYRDVIVKPIALLAQRGRQITISATLIDELVNDAQGADALPLLAFTLFKLYIGFGAGGHITSAQYSSMGGIAGSIREAVKEALAKPYNAPVIPTSAEDQMAGLRATFVPWLARIEADTGEPLRRIALVNDFEGASRSFVDRLVEKRLLVRDRRATGDVVEIAHESLLRQWPPLVAWLNEAADDLRGIDAIERSASEWIRNERQSAWLDHRADRLSRAERLVSRREFRKRLGPDSIAYIRACRARETRQRRVAQVLAWTSAVVFALFSLLFLFLWQRTLNAQTELQASLLVTESQLDLSNNNVESAVDHAARAFALAATPASRSALLQSLIEVSPHLRSTFALGSDAGEALHWISDDRVELATTSGLLHTFQTANSTSLTAGVPLVNITRTQDGNRSVVRALARVNANTFAVFDEGSIVVYQGRTALFQWHPQAQTISIRPAQHAVSIGRSGGLIALATTDDAILIYSCEWRTPTGSCHPNWSLANVKGRTVAISRDEKRIAVGDATGAVRVFDRDGYQIGSPLSFDGPVNALAWAEQSDWLALGTSNGEIGVLDATATEMRIVAKQKFGEHSVTAIVFSSKDNGLAFVCDGSAICRLRLNTDTNSSHPFKVAMRHAGHHNLITRLSIAPTGEQLASSSTDGTVRIWSFDQDTQATSILYGADTSRISTVAVSPNRRWVAGGTLDGNVELWDSQTGVIAQSIKAPDDFSEVDNIAWSETGVLATIRGHTVDVISPESEPSVLRIPMKARAGYRLTWVDSGKKIAVSLMGSGVVLLDPHSPGASPTFFGKRNSADEIYGVQAIPNSQLLLVTSIGGDITVWDWVTQKPVASMPSNIADDRTGIGSLSISADGHLLAASSGNRSVALYDISKRTIWQTLLTDAYGITAVAFSPDGRKLAALGDQRLYVWTIGTVATPYLSVAAPRRAVVGDRVSGTETLRWMDWISNNRILLATSASAIRTINIDSEDWRKRIDSVVVRSLR